MQAVNRMTQLLAKTSPKLIVNGLFTSSGDIARDPKQMVGVFSTKWGPTFTRKEIDLPKAKEFTSKLNNAA